MSKPVTVRGRVMDAKYVREEHSIVVILEDPETKRCTKPIQISSSQFTFRPDQDVDDEMLKTAALLKKYPHPISLVFEGDDSTGPAGLSPAALNGPVIPVGMGY
jgi:hypothetical protein